MADNWVPVDSFPTSGDKPADAAAPPSEWAPVSGNYMPPPLQEQVMAQQPGSPGDAFAASLALGAAQRFSAYRQHTPFAESRSDLLARKATWGDIEKLAGMELGPTGAEIAKGIGSSMASPAALATSAIAPEGMFSRLAMGALQGAEGAAMSTPDAAIADNVISGGTAGMAVDAGLQGLGVAGRIIKGPIIGNILGSATPPINPSPFRNALEAPAAQQARENFKRIGVQPTVTQEVLPVTTSTPQGEHTQRILDLDASASGNAGITSMLRQGEELQKSAEVLSDYVAPNGKINGVGERVGTALLGKMAALRNAQKYLWERGLGSAARVVGDRAIVNGKNLSQTVDAYIANESAEPGAREAARRLKTILDRRKAAGSGRANALSVGDLDEALNVIDKLGNVFSATEKDPAMFAGKSGELYTAAQAMRRALFDDMDKVPTIGNSKAAVDLLRTTRAGYDRLEGQAQSIVNSTLGKLRLGTVPGQHLSDEAVLSTISGMGKGDAKWLYSFLNMNSPQTLYDVQRAMLTRAGKIATEAGKLKPAGTPQFDLTGFMGAINKLHGSELFDPQQMSEIAHASRALQRIQRSFVRMGGGNAVLNEAGVSQSAAAVASGHPIGWIFTLRNAVLHNAPNRWAKLLLDPGARKALIDMQSPIAQAMAGHLDNMAGSLDRAMKDDPEYQKMLDAIEHAMDSIRPPNARTEAEVK